MTVSSIHYKLRLLTLLFLTQHDTAVTYANKPISLPLSHQNSSNSFTILIVCGREGESAKASEKQALTTLENPNSNEVAVTAVIEKPSFLKLNKEGKATTTTTASYHTESESAL